MQYQAIYELRVLAVLYTVKPNKINKLNYYLLRNIPIIPSLAHPIPLNPLTTIENPIVAPTMLCVPETGSFRNVAKINQMQEPREKRNIVTFLFILLKILTLFK